MRLIIFSQPSVFIRGHLHAQLATLSKRAITNTWFARLISKRLSCGESSLKSLINSGQAVFFLSAYSEQMLAFALFSFLWRIDLRSLILNTKHYILSEQRGRERSLNPPHAAAARRVGMACAELAGDLSTAEGHIEKRFTERAKRIIWRCAQGWRPKYPQHWLLCHVGLY